MSAVADTGIFSVGALIISYKKQFCPTFDFETSTFAFQAVITSS